VRIELLLTADVVDVDTENSITTLTSTEVGLLVADMQTYLQNYDPPTINTMGEGTTLALVNLELS